MVIPKTLAQNSGFDPQDTIVKLQVLHYFSLLSLCGKTCLYELQEEYVKTGQPVGVDISTGTLNAFEYCYHVSFCTYTLPIGEALLPANEGIWDNYRVKRTILHSWYGQTCLAVINYCQSVELA